MFFGVDLMNELQQVLLIFAVVVIAGLYFLSRSRQNTGSKSEQKTNKTASPLNQNKKTHESTNNPHNEPVLGDIPLASTTESKEQASEALNNLGTPHIPVSESTERRFTESRGMNHVDNNTHDNQQTTNHTSIEQSINDDYNRNQGVLFFGEEFDLQPTEKPQEPEEKSALDVAVKSNETTDSVKAPESINIAEAKPQKQEQLGPKHHVLIVDDPGMTGEVSGTSNSSEFIKPSFGIPEEEKTTKQYKSSTNKAPEVYVLLVMTTAHEFSMTDVNQALLGVGLTHSDQGIFVKNDNMGNAFIKVANMLEPGTFPQENLEEFATPGVAMILELPTTVRAPAAMHDLIIMARKVSQRLHGRLYNAERQLIKESDLQSMRDAALDYESIPIA